jgi:glyoxalase family protein
VPAEHALTGIEGARAYSAYARVEERVLTDTLGFTHLGDGEYRLDGESRRFHWGHDPAPALRGHQGAGSVHHIAWASRDEDHARWQERIRDAGGYVTDVRDRDYFKAIYFREPRGVLFEIATLSPGFAVDEDPAHLGEALRLPEQHEHLREQLERTLTPVVNPRAAARA